MKHPRFAHTFEVVSELPEPLRPLRKLALNFRWTWRPEVQALFERADGRLWELSGHNPVELLSALPAARVQELAEDSSFVEALHSGAHELDEYLSSETWFDRAHPGRREETLIAYFCAEFGVSESLPIYSGGLGVLAGDHLKAASDLGVPLVGVGLLYARGYFRQRLTPDGWQHEDYPQYDFYRLPLELMVGPDQAPIRIEIENEHEDRPIVCQIWKAQIGRVPLLLLDSNVLENAPGDQGITDTLYGGDQETRLRQEMILGVGGIRALRALGYNPAVCHMNEGHSAFLAVERLRQLMKESGCEYSAARVAASAGNVFTTHTPVAAGFDAFPVDLTRRHAARMAQAAGLSFESLLAMGRGPSSGEDEPFNMALLAIDNAGYVNGVSKLHAEVARGMFQHLWPGFIEGELPVSAVTNGIHTATWTGARFAELFESRLGPAWRESPADAESWSGIESIPDEEIWRARCEQREELVNFVRRRLAKNRAGIAEWKAADLDAVLDPKALTVGFARRFATYKRANLMLSDRERLKRLLFDSARPLQIVLAGKSHPRDDAGKGMIQQLIGFIRDERAQSRMVFLEDYDMEVARALVHGVDVWLNNPRRPLEASGTSGMKVVPNGGLNCSILDGWWDEAYRSGLGWAFGEHRDYSDAGYQDWLDAMALYDVLEKEVLPKFYGRGPDGVPGEWVAMIKRSIGELAPAFSAERMVREYVDHGYEPAWNRFARFTEHGFAAAESAVEWRERVRAAWDKVKVVRVHDTADKRNVVGFELSIRAEVELGAIDPGEVAVQAIVGEVGANRELRTTRVVELSHVRHSGTCHEFEARVRCESVGHGGYTVRVIPRHPDVGVPKNLTLATWE